MNVMFCRGYLDYKEKMAHYWPEFGVNGKELITVEMLLSHQVLHKDKKFINILPAAGIH